MLSVSAMPAATPAPRRPTPMQAMLSLLFGEGPALRMLNGATPGRGRGQGALEEGATLEVPIRFHDESFSGGRVTWFPLMAARPMGPGDQRKTGFSCIRRACLVPCQGLDLGMECHWLRQCRSFVARATPILSFDRALNDRAWFCADRVSRP